MNWKFVAALAFGILLSACQPPATNTNTAPANNANTTNMNAAKSDATQPQPATNLQELARRIVTQSAGVKEGEIVLVSGGIRDMQLLEDIVIEVEKVGGQPLLSIGSERMAKRYYDEVPAKYDSSERKLGMALARTANVTINVENTETEGLLANVPRERLAANAKAGQPVGAEYRKNRVRSVNVGNELYPTEWRAKRFDMPLGDFSKMFWEGVNIDYTNLQATGEKARTALTGKEVEITHPNGTNLKMNIENRPVYISDGIISEDDVQKGNLAVYLPAGEAAVTPAPNSGDGKFVIEKQYFEGKEVNNLTLTFAGGKLTEMTGEGPGFEAMKADYDAYPEGKELLGFFDIGLNENMKFPANTKTGNWVSAGMVTVGTGNNTWANGTNNVSGGVFGHLSGATVKIDGRTIVENGVLKL
ncbi:MAG TPA: aminopeptidase [Pyrinomonadaceae bacterium]|nr:aminopeptidase [Pyrinomonadaceae bacterium]